METQGLESSVGLYFPAGHGKHPVEAPVTRISNPGMQLQEQPDVWLESLQFAIGAQFVQNPSFVELHVCNDCPAHGPAKHTAHAVSPIPVLKDPVLHVEHVGEATKALYVPA